MKQLVNFENTLKNDIHNVADTYQLLKDNNIPVYVWASAVMDYERMGYLSEMIARVDGAKLAYDFYRAGQNGNPLTSVVDSFSRQETKTRISNWMRDELVKYMTDRGIPEMQCVNMLESWMSRYSRDLMSEENDMYQHRMIRRMTGEDNSPRTRETLRSNGLQDVIERITRDWGAPHIEHYDPEEPEYDEASERSFL